MALLLKEVTGISSSGSMSQCMRQKKKPKVVKLGEKAVDEEECGAVSQSVTGKGDYAELRAVIEHRRARPHLHLSLLPALIGSCT